MARESWYFPPWHPDLKSTLMTAISQHPPGPEVNTTVMKLSLGTQFLLSLADFHGFTFVLSIESQVKQNTMNLDVCSCVGLVVLQLQAGWFCYVNQEQVASCVFIHPWFPCCHIPESESCVNSLDAAGRKSWFE